MGLEESKCSWKECSGLIECKTEQELLSKLIFIESRNLNNQQLGLQETQIFRMKEAPYECIMRTSKTLTHESQASTKYFQTLRRLSQYLVHKNIAPLHFVQIRRENNMCMRTTRIHHYSSFYGLELRDTIQTRKRDDWRFDQSEVLYVARSMVSMGAFLKKQNFAFGAFNSKNIFLSCEGFLKVYLFHLEPDNKHHQYFSLLCNRLSNLSDVSTQLPVAPQCLPHIQEGNLCPDLNLEKADTFNVGMILVQMMVNNSLQRYYNIRRDSIKFESRKLTSDLEDISALYDPSLIRLVRMLTQEDPQLRWDMDEADEFVTSIKSRLDFACRLQMSDEGPEQNCTSNKLSYQQSKQPSTEFILRSIQNDLGSKLNAAPLKSISKLATHRSSGQDIHKTIYTRRNTGVSIISNSGSLSTSQHKPIIQGPRNDGKRHPKSPRGIQNRLVGHSHNSSVIEWDKTKGKPNSYEKQGQTWMALGSTRGNDENSQQTSIYQPIKSVHKIRGKCKLHLNLPHQRIQQSRNARKGQSFNSRSGHMASSELSENITVRKESYPESVKELQTDNSQMRLPNFMKVTRKNTSRINSRLLR